MRSPASILSRYGNGENDFFHQATQQICSSLDIETSLRNSLVFLKDCIPIDLILLQVYDYPNSVMRMVSMVTDNDSYEISRLVPIPKNIRDDLLKRWRSIEKFVILNRPDAQPIHKELSFYRENNDVSVIVVILELEGERLGQLVVSIEGLDKYREEHGQLLSMLSAPFSMAISNALKYQELLHYKERIADENRYLYKELHRQTGDRIIGEEYGLKEVMTKARQVAGTDSPVLLLGETGTGKEVIANAVHYLSHRRDGPFIKVNCGAIPEQLLDSELFGHEKEPSPEHLK